MSWVNYNEPYTVSTGEMSVWDGSQCSAPLKFKGGTLVKEDQPFLLNGIILASQSGGYGGYCPDPTNIATSQAQVRNTVRQLAAYGVNCIRCGAIETYAYPSGMLDNSFTTYNSNWFEVFDAFLDECRLRGIYILIIGDIVPWKNVMTVASIPLLSTNNNGLWFLDGSYGEPNYLQACKNHLTRIYNNINTQNGIRYGADYTMAFYNPWNESGILKAYINGTSTAGTTNDTLDYIFRGSFLGTANFPIVADAIDSRWNSFRNSTYTSAPTWNNGTACTKMPAYRYTGDVSRFTYNVGTPTNAEIERVWAFIAYLEQTFHAALKAHIKQLCPHIIYVSAQNNSNYISHGSAVEAEMLDAHTYLNNPNTSGKYQTYSSNMAATCSWAAGTLTVTGVAAAGNDSLSRYSATVGRICRIITTNGTSYNAEVPIASVTSGATGTISDTSPRSYTFSVATDLSSCTTCVVRYSGFVPNNHDIGPNSAFGSPALSGNGNFGNNLGIYSRHWYNKGMMISECGTNGLSLHAEHGFGLTHAILTLLQNYSGIFFANWSPNGGIRENAANGDLLLSKQPTKTFVLQIISLLFKYGNLPSLPTTLNVYASESTVLAKARASVGMSMGAGTFITPQTGEYSNTYFLPILRKTNFYYPATDVTPPDTTGLTFDQDTYSPVTGLTIKRNLSYWIVATPTIELIFGYIPASGSGVTVGDMLITSDSDYWGCVARCTKTGNALSQSPQLLFSFMFSRAEDMFNRTGGPGGNVEGPSDYQYTSYGGVFNATQGSPLDVNGVLYKQVGVESKDNLRIRISNASSLNKLLVTKKDGTTGPANYKKTGSTIDVWPLNSPRIYIA